MKRYIHKLKQRPTHERRRFSMQAAAVLTAVIFLVWLSTLGVRLASSVSQGTTVDAGTAQLVAAAGAVRDSFSSATLQTVGTSSPDQAQAQTPEQSAAPATVLNAPDASQGSSDTSQDPTQTDPSAVTDTQYQAQ